jgi:hypothetical protein
MPTDLRRAEGRRSVPRRSVRFPYASVTGRPAAKLRCRSHQPGRGLLAGSVPRVHRRVARRARARDRQPRRRRGTTRSAGRRERVTADRHVCWNRDGRWHPPRHRARSCCQLKPRARGSRHSQIGRHRPRPSGRWLQLQRYSGCGTLPKPSSLRCRANLMHPICTLDNLDEGLAVGRAANQILWFAGLLTKWS